MPEFGNLSPDQIKQFTLAVEAFQKGLNDQNKLVDKLIKSEVKLHDLRIAKLQEYADTYCASLDKITRGGLNLSDFNLVVTHEIEKQEKENKNTNSNNKNVDQGSNNNGGNGSNGGNSGGGSEEPDGDQLIQPILEASEAGKKAVEEIKDKYKAAVDFMDTLSARYHDDNRSRMEALYADEKEREKELASLREEHSKDLEKKAFSKQERLAKEMKRLYALEHEDREDKERRLTALRMNNTLEVVKAEADRMEGLRDFEAELAFMSDKDVAENSGVNEAGALAVRKREAEQASAYEQKVRKNMLAQIAAEEEKIIRKKGKLTAEQATEIRRKAAEEAQKQLDEAEERMKKEAAMEDALKQKGARKNTEEGIKQLFHGETTTERVKALKELTTNEQGNFDAKKAMLAAVTAVSAFAKQLEVQINEIAGYQTEIDTRLNGSNLEQHKGSYWDKLQKEMMSIGAINPYYKQADFANNIKDLVDRGIAFDLKQRAFLMTIQKKIATTFDVADGTLLRLIRIQQQDSTAGRLGMEVALNSFLNNMYENTEYLKTVAAGVRGSLEEMQALMEGAAGAEVEYQVQKWLGSLYSVGMSQEAANSIASALGQIAAGQIEGITNGGAGNLLIMAANDAGIPIADILTNGITAEETNKLLKAAVNYLADLADSAKDNKVVQQQLANVFGVKASDLRAAGNLVIPGSMGAISGNTLNYGGMVSQLIDMASTMGDRTSLAEMVENFKGNLKYTLASSVASSPVSYLIYNMASMLDDTVGGIDLPFLNVMGFGVDLNTTVADLMRVAAMGGGILGSLGEIVSGLGSSFSGRSMLSKMGITSKSGLQITPRGEGISMAAGGTPGSSQSQAGVAGNSSGSDVKDSTIQESEDSKDKQMIEAKEEEEANKVDFLNETVLKIYELLNAVATGENSFKVKVEGYGLTSSGSVSAAALGGVDALLGGSSSSSGSGGGSGGNSAISGGSGGAIDFKGWTSV